MGVQQLGVQQLGVLSYSLLGMADICIQDTMFFWLSLLIIRFQVL